MKPLMLKHSRSLLGSEDCWSVEDGHKRSPCSTANTQSEELGLHCLPDFALPVQSLTSAIYDGSFWDVAASTSGNRIELFLICHKLGNNFHPLPMDQTRVSHLERKGPLKPITSLLKYPVPKQT